MKKITNVLLILSLVITLCFPSYAMQCNYYYLNPISSKSTLLPYDINQSAAKERAVKRGAFFAGADLTITNRNGEIGVTGKSYMTYPVDELYMSIYVDKLEENRWVQVAYYDFEFYAENYPDGLTSEMVDFTIDNQPKGHYYRLRGSYAAIKDGDMEGFGPMTDGVLIE